MCKKPFVCVLFLMGREEWKRQRLCGGQLNLTLEAHGFDIFDNSMQRLMDEDLGFCVVECLGGIKNKKG